MAKRRRRKRVQTTAPDSFPEVVTLESELFQKTHRLYLLNTAMSSNRRSFEAKFQGQLAEFLQLWFIELARLSVKTDFLTNVERMTQTVGQTVPLAERKEYVESVTNSMIEPLATAVLDLQQREDLSTIIATFGLQAYTFGAKTALKSMGFSSDVTESFDLTDVEEIDRLMDHAIDMSRSIMAETIHDVKRLVLDDLAQGNANVDTLAMNIANSLDLRIFKAQKIARTEVQHYYNSGLFETYKRSGVKRKRWLRVGDSKTRYEHQANADQGWIEMDQRFMSGQLHPGDTADNTGANINCRCSLEAELKEDTETAPWSGGGIKIDQDAVNVGVETYDQADDEIENTRVTLQDVRRWPKPTISNAGVEVVQTPAQEQ